MNLFESIKNNNTIYKLEKELKEIESKLEIYDQLSDLYEKLNKKDESELYTIKHNRLYRRSLEMKILINKLEGENLKFELESFDRD